MSIDDGPRVSADVDDGEARTVPGEPGVWVFVLGDMVIFAVFFATYLAYRAGDPALFSRSQGELTTAFGAVNTIVLLLSSLLLAAAVRRMRLASWAGPDRRASWLIAGAIALGVVFSIIKIIEYSGEVGRGITPLSNDFFLCYFMFTGVHWFHVLIGLAVLGTILRFSTRTGLTVRQRVFVEGGACFWHMVDLLWIVLFPLFYLAR
jgi:nitric oxide reductase NorE protein